jgi:hypothetical protein
LELATKSLLAQGLYGAAQVVNFFNNPQTKAWLSAAAQQNPTAFLAFVEFIRQQLGTFQQVPISLANPFGLIFVPSNFYPTGNPHIRYGSDKPPSLPTGLAGVNSNSTYVDIGIAYLNARGAAVAPR